MSIILFNSHLPLATSHSSWPLASSHSFSFLLANSTATTLFLLGLLLIVGVVLRGARRKSSSRLPPVSSWGKSSLSEERSSQRDLPRDLGQWEVQMHELARDLSGQLDSKIVILQHLVRDAQQQADRLEKALARASGSERPAPPVSEAAHQGVSTSPARPAIATLSVPARRRDEICRLSEQGYTSAAIAQETGCPIGEIELILSVRNKAG